MPAKPRSLELCQRAVDMMALHGTQIAASAAMGIPRPTLQDILRDPKTRKLKPTVAPRVQPPPEVDIGASIRSVLSRRSASINDLMTATGAGADEILTTIDGLIADGYNIVRRGSGWEIPKQQAQIGYVNGPTIEILSRADNTFLLGACGDQHIGSKYFRHDVLTDIYNRYERAGVQAVCNTGNWVDGDARFNQHDLVAHGIDAQAQLLAELYPRKEFKTLAVVGADHEGWWAAREGIDVGRYVEGVMRRNGREDWQDIGFMEAHIRLVNANTGAVSVLAVVHPGGGSAYALSYSIQKILESLEGGEKPAIGFYGHFHKMWSGNIRNVWAIQTGTTQDQTPFMRQKRLEAHVGAYMVGLEQDPETGAIIGCTATAWRYFNRAYYENASRWSKSGAVQPLPRTLGGLR